MTLVNTYEEKPVTIEAVRVPVYQEYMDDPTRGITAYVNDCIETADWCSGTSYMMNEEDDHILLRTSAGPCWILPGDYIVKGDNGDFHACSAALFESTYQKAHDATTAPSNAT